MASFFNGKVAIVTGSSNGIGRCTAVMLAQRGAKVTITGRNAESIAETKRQCVAAGAKPDDIHEVLGDIENEETTKRIVAETVAKFGQLDVLVNNAGMAITMGKEGLDTPLEVFDRTIAINIRSVISMVQLAEPHLAKTKGAVVNISSIGSLPFHHKGDGYYGIAKAALDRATVQQAGELIKKGVRVNCINPGMVVTDFISKLGVPQDIASNVYKNFSSDPHALPLGRPGVPEDIAKLILFLADRSQSEFIIGQCIIADGGTVIKNYACCKEFL